MLSQTTVFLVEIVGIEKMADAMGLSNMFCGFGALMGPPLLGMSKTLICHAITVIFIRK